MIVHALARDFGAPTCVCRRQYFEPVDSQRCFTVIRMQWPEGFRGRIPCPEFLVGCSSLFRKKLPIPIMSLAKPGSKQESPVYQTPPGCPGPGMRLALNCTMEVRAKQFVLGHIAIGDGRRRWFVSAEIDLPEFAIFGGWINVWMGEGDHVGGAVTQPLIGTLYCTLSLDSRWLNAKPYNGYVCMCGCCEEEWLDQGWICKLIRLSERRQHLKRKAALSMRCECKVGETKCKYALISRRRAMPDAMFVRSVPPDCV